MPAQTGDAAARISRFEPALDRVIASDPSVEKLATIPVAIGKGPIRHRNELWVGDVAVGSIYALERNAAMRVVTRVKQQDQSTRNARPGRRRKVWATGAAGRT
jgi:hypothetical protein